MKQIGFQFIFFITIILLFLACNRNNDFEEYHPVAKNGWHKDSLLVFTVPVTDTLQNHNLYVNVRNDVKYQYSNLWLFIKIMQPGESVTSDTLEVTIANPAGKWLGEGFGGIKTLQMRYKSGVYFPVSGEYKIIIQHGMRDELLKGITDIGFRIE